MLSFSFYMSNTDIYTALIALMILIIIYANRNYDSTVTTSMFTFALYVSNSGINAALIAFCEPEKSAV